jgi:hypothetical protein
MSRATAATPGRKIAASGAGGPKRTASSPNTQIAAIRAAAERLRAAGSDAEVNEVFALMLDDIDRRIEAISERTDALMARAGLA